jgi:MFS family permease
VLAFATLVNRAGTMVLPFLALHLTQNVGLSPEEAGRQFFLYGAVALVVSPLAGRLADRIGAVRLMRASLVGSALCLWAFLLAKDIASVTLATLALALTTEPFRPANMALVGALAEGEKRKAAFALNRLAINLGMSVGPAVGGLLATTSFSALFWIDGFSSLVAAAVLTLFKLEEPPRAVATAPTGSFGSTASDRRLLLFNLALLPVMLVFFQHAAAMPLHLVQGLGFSERFFGFLATANTILIVLFEVRLNGLTARWPVARALWLGALFCAVGFSALALTTSAVGVVLTVVIWTVGEMILFPASATYVSDISPPHRRGEYMGIYTMGFGVSFALGPWLGTAAMQRFGPTALWGACLVVGGVSALLLKQLAVGPRGVPALAPEEG